jgi:hypothetical protein
MRHLALAVALLATCGLTGSSVRTAELDIPPRPPAENFSMQKGPPNCSRWTDGCVNCSRGAEDEGPLCTNIGVACQPKAIRCISPEAGKN